MQFTFDAGAAIVGAVALVGGFIVRDRQVMRAIGEGDGKIHARVDELTKSCVTKNEVDRLNDKTDLIIKEYVQKSDLDSHLEPMKTTLMQISVSLRENNRRIDTVLEKILNNKSNQS
jgi:predicted RNase H-like nuclease (RuvC/YqgF family)